MPALIFISCNNKEDEGNDDNSAVPITKSPAVQAIAYNIIAQYPHDTASYTQGLEFYNGKLYESGGDYANSFLQFGDAKTGKIERKNKMGTDKIFGEGITILNRKLYQLTWESNIVYVYDVNDITKVIKTFPWPYEGWGISHNSTDLIISTGGADVYIVDPETFKIKNTVHVHDDNGPVFNINELEYVNGFVWANIYQTKDIVKIDLQTGAIAGKMNFNNLPAPDSIPGRTDVLNGIAYDSASKSLFITGKRWSKMYELKIN